MGITSFVFKTNCMILQKCSGLVRQNCVFGHNFGVKQYELFLDTLV